MVKLLPVLDLPPYIGIFRTWNNLHPAVAFLQTGRANIMTTAHFVIDLGSI